MTLSKDMSSESCRLAISVLVRDGVRIDVDNVAKRILAEFQNATITAADSFGAERKRIQTVAKKHAKERKSLQGFDLLLTSSKNKERAMGPGCDMTIPITNEQSFAGHIWAKSIKFAGNCSRLDALARKLVAFLSSLEVGEVEIVEF